MSLPIAHCSVALGLVGSRSTRLWTAVAFLALLPDFDFALVRGLGVPLDEFHRTFSHSVVFFAFLTLLWSAVRERLLPTLSCGLFFLALFSHSFLDTLCTADANDHGVMLLWPLSSIRLGWAVLVPLYRPLADSPFHLQGAFLFFLLECVLAYPLWAAVRLVKRLSTESGSEREPSTLDAF
ncbi:MAG: metal-dependent hydrolase [Acidobacteria bacterium]|nr:metal-dependent hydrolase [Acidobacteriota bacterium]